MLILWYKAACLRKMIRHEMAYRRHGFRSARWTATIHAAIIALAEAGF